MPDDLPPPVVPATPVVPEPEQASFDEEPLEATGLMEPVEPATEPELDARELKALSRQERKAAKAALRREQQEARAAARQAKAEAKAAAKLEEAASAANAATEVTSGLAQDEDVVEEAPEEVDEPTVEDVDEVADDTADESAESADMAPAATDPRARAAQRVQRRLGKDAEKLSAAEARARAREEARRRRAQAKEQRSGAVAEEAVRPPEETTEGNLTEDVSVVGLEDTSRWDDTPEFDQPGIAEQTIIAEPVVGEPDAEQTIVAEPIVGEVVEEPEADLPRPVFGQRIDEPAPADADEQSEPTVVYELEPIDADEEVETVAVEEPVAVDDEPALTDDDRTSSTSRSSLAPVAGVVGLIALGISVLLAVGALLVALGFDSGGLYEALRTVANLLVGPLEGAFDFSGANAERKEHFLAWGAGSIGYLLISFVGQAVQRANDEQ